MRYRQEDIESRPANLRGRMHYLHLFGTMHHIAFKSPSYNFELIQRSTLLCKRQVCPVLTCSPEFQERSSGECCAKCVHSAPAYCETEDATYNVRKKPSHPVFWDGVGVYVSPGVVCCAGPFAISFSKIRPLTGEVVLTRDTWAGEFEIASTHIFCWRGPQQRFVSPITGSRSAPFASEKYPKSMKYTETWHFSALRSS